ncbi:zinc ribbon domain-containing protein [Anaerolineales bacterium HSG24]|nr:zinc ribbon domain-containing protein [Anaerolineales bacterium HSG24]
MISSQPEATRCLDPKCRKQIPKSIRYCPYCGMPVIQRMLPRLTSTQLKRTAILVGLIIACLLVYRQLSYELSHFGESNTPQAVVIPSPTTTRFPTATKTPFPKLILTTTPTLSPTPHPDTAKVVMITPTPTPTPFEAIVYEIYDTFRLYREPDYTSAAVFGYPAGGTVIILGIEPTRQWLWVDADGFKGWLNAGLTRGEVEFSQLPIIDIEE